MNGLVGKTLEYGEQLIKYGIAGFAAALFDIGALYILTDRAGVYYLLSAAISFCLGVLVNYTISTSFVFKKRRMESKYREFAAFLGIGILGLLLNLLLIWLLTERFNLYYMHSKYISVATVFFFNFNMRKFILFN